MRGFKLWLPIIYTLVMLFALSDETNIVLFLLSPPFWLVETSWFVENFFHPSKIPLPLICTLTIAFWFLVGVIIDISIRKLRNKKTNN